MPFPRMRRPGGGQRSPRDLRRHGTRPDDRCRQIGMGRESGVEKGDRHSAARRARRPRRRERAQKSARRRRGPGRACGPSRPSRCLPARGLPRSCACFPGRVDRTRSIRSRRSSYDLASVRAAQLRHPHLAILVGVVEVNRVADLDFRHGHVLPLRRLGPVQCPLVVLLTRDDERARSGSIRTTFPSCGRCSATAADARATEPRTTERSHCVVCFCIEPPAGEKGQETRQNWRGEC